MTKMNRVLMTIYKLSGGDVNTLCSESEICSACHECDSMYLLYLDHQGLLSESVKNNEKAYVILPAGIEQIEHLVTERKSKRIDRIILIVTLIASVIAAIASLISTGLFN